MQITALISKEATLSSDEQKRVVKEYLSKLLNKNLGESEYFDTEFDEKDSAVVVRKWFPFKSLPKNDIVRYASEEEVKLSAAINLIRAEMEKSEK